MEKKRSIITKDFCILFAVSVFICTGMNMLNVTIPLYVTETLGQSVGTAGLMSTVYTIAACASRPINGALTDRFGRRKVMAIGSAFFAAACVLCGVIPSILCVTICRALMGLGYSAASTANNTASTDILPADRMAEGVGYFGMSQSLASAVGPALAALAVGLVGNRGSLYVSALTGAAALIAALAVTYEKKPGYSRPKAEKRSGAFFEKTAVMPSVFEGLSLFLISCLMCFMTLYIVSRGLTSAVAGYFFLASSVMIIVIRMVFSRLLAGRKPFVFLIPGYGLLILACLLLPRTDTAAAFVGIGLLFGGAHGIIWMTLGSEAVRLAAPERRGAANATFYFAFDAAIGIGAAVWGQLIDGIGYDRCFQLVAVGALVLAVCSVPVFAKRK